MTILMVLVSSSPSLEQYLDIGIGETRICKNHVLRPVQLGALRTWPTPLAVLESDLVLQKQKRQDDFALIACKESTRAREFPMSKCHAF